MMEKTKKSVTVTIPAVSFGFMLIGSMLVVFPAVNGHAQSRRGIVDRQRGMQLFEKRCGGCHALDQDQTGPRLRNVYGRKAGSVSTFRYSAALKSAKLTWDDALLDQWLSNPDSLVADNEMDFHVPKADERAAIIRFLRLSSGK